MISACFTIAFLNFEYDNSCYRIIRAKRRKTCKRKREMSNKKKRKKNENGKRERKVLLIYPSQPSLFSRFAWYLSSNCRSP